MKRTLISFFTTAILFIGIKPVRADYDVFGYQYSGDASVGNYIYGLDTETGERTLLTTRLFEGNSISNTYVSGNTGELIFKTGSAGTYEAYNWHTNTWRTFEIDNASETVSGSLTIVDTHPKIIDGTIPQITTNKNNITTNKNNINNLGEGVANSTALMAALTSLPQVSTETKLSCGAGTGAYSGKYALGLGCASKINENIDINFGGSIVGGGSKNYGNGSLDPVVARAGFVWKLGKPVKPTLISMKEKKEFETQINTLEETNKQLLARLEKLEKVALGSIQSKDLASNKINFKSLNRELKKNDF